MTVKLVDLKKSYGSVDVLQGVNLEFEQGEVHALLGANGAGKSTLLGCLSGATVPTSGSIVIDDRTFEGFAPREAIEAGISIIYQHFQLATTLSVSDNVFLGDERRTRWRFLDKREQERQTSEVLKKINLDLDPRSRVDRLSVGQQQGIEIARSVRREPRLLILDEPTAALGKHEVEALLRLVKRLAHDLGVAVIFVTHLLGEVMDVADRVSILREGRVLWTRARSAVTLPDMIEAISPSVVQAAAAPSTSITAKDFVSFDGLETNGCGPIDLAIREGEIVGVYGMLGCGRTNLLETIAGARGPWKGTLCLGTETLAYRSIAQAIRSGIALVASDRLAQSLFASLSAQENLMMPHYSSLSRFWRWPGREKAIFAGVAADVQLHPARSGINGSAFSGGNAQKLVLGRWLAGLQNVRLLLLDEPTQGVDVGSRAKIYSLLRRFAEGAPGRAVLFSTSDPEEAIALADRIIILVNGRIERIVTCPTDEAEIIALAQSVHVDGAPHRSPATEGRPERSTATDPVFR